MDSRDFNVICFLQLGRLLGVVKAAFPIAATGVDAGPRPDLHVVERAPAAVGVSRAQALPAGRVLLAGLHGHPGHLQGRSTASVCLLAWQAGETRSTR